MNKIKYIENLVVLFFSFVFSFVMLTYSPVHPWVNTETYTDSSVFKTVALMMESGYMPYKDTFDHKGPLLYFINLIGNKLNYYNGVFYIELFFWIITLIALYRSIRLKCKPAASYIILLSAFSLFYIDFQGGNLTEEYALPFISISTFIFLDFLLNEKISKLRLVLCGACLGVILCLRPNMIALWVVMCIFVVIKERKNFKNLCRYISFFMLGMVIIFFPIFCWIIKNGLFKDFWSVYIEFNKTYSSAEGGRALFSAKWNAFFHFLNNKIYVISILSLIFLSNKSNNKLNITYIIYMFISLMFIAMSGMTYEHYGLVLIPVCIYPLSLLYEIIEKIDNKDMSKILFVLLSMFFLSNFVISDCIDTIIRIPELYESRNFDNDSYVEKMISDQIKIYAPNYGESISVYGNWDYIYVKNKKIHATKYSYQFPIGKVKKEIFDEYFEQLKNEKPHVIVIQAGYWDNNIEEFVDTYNYRLVYTEKDDASGVLVYAY